MLKNVENIASQNLPILYTFVLRAEIRTTFRVRVVQISACIIEMYTKIANLQGYIFRIFQHFATKFCTFTIFDMIFSAVVMSITSSTAAKR